MVSAPAPSSLDTTTDRRPAETRSEWIPEVQGLRTLALLLVATFHIWFGRVSGGVDVFLVVSAFLMTRSLHGRLERDGTFSTTAMIGYTVRRFARLLPLAVAVAAATLVLCVTFLPTSRLDDFVEQFFASVVYAENRWLQDASVDYLAADSSLASPFQHFWSLSVQGQVFLLWPLLFVGIGVAHRRWGVPVRRLALAVFGAILVAGFVWSVLLTGRDQPLAYFDLGARVWEFAAGSVLALVLPWLRFGPRVRGVLSWLGIAGALLCGFVMPVDGVFPGVAALWPVVSTALVIMGTGARTDRGGDRLLTHPVLSNLGAYTYALYLIHWPVLVFTLAATRTERLDLATGTLVLVGSTILSILAVHLIDRPIARLTVAADGAGRPWRAGLVLLLLPVLAFGVARTADHWIDGQRDVARMQVSSAPVEVIGPNSDPAGMLAPTEDVVPGVWVANQDLGFLYGCHEESLPAGVDARALAHCQSNIQDVDPATADRSVVVVGNSHAQQVTQLVAETARQSNWAVRAYLQFGCQFDGLGLESDPDHHGSCRDMWADATADVLASRPDAVFVMASQSTPQDSETDLPGLEEWIRQISAAGIQVVAVRDNPRSDLHMVDCAERYGFSSDECTWQTSLVEPNGALEQAMTAAGAIYLDPNPSICPEGVCRAQVGGVVTFFDSNHVSATYMRALAYTVSPELRASIPWWTDLRGAPAV